MNVLQFFQNSSDTSGTPPAWSAITEACTAAISLTNADLDILYANAATLTLINSALLPTRNWRRMVHPAYAEELENAIATALKTPGTPINICIRVNNESNAYPWVDGSVCNMLHNPDVQALVFTLTDTTAIRQANEEMKGLNDKLELKIAERSMQLEATNRELDAFSYSVSHDMRAPLRIINGYAEMLHTDYKHLLDEEGNRLLEIVITNTHHMSGMIDALLNLARIGRKELMIMPADMTAIVNNSINEHIAAAGTSVNIKFDVQNILPASCDGTLIRTVWGNLITNAITHTAQMQQPLITIGSEQKDDKVVYYIKDNGEGFQMQYAHKLFGVFQRLHKKTENSGPATGLAMVQRIILMHGGYVWAEGAENKGATFYFTLPAKN